MDDNETLTNEDDAAIEAADAAADEAATTTEEPEAEPAEAPQEPAEATEATPEPTADAPATEAKAPGIWELELINPRTRQPELHQVPGADEAEARANIRPGFQEVGGTIRRVV